MARLFQIIVCLAAAGLADAACDTTKATTDVGDCTKATTDCSTKAGADICAMAKCSVDMLDCSANVYSDTGCCADLEAAFDAAKKAWDDAIEANKDAYKDCSDEDIKWQGECKAGAGGDSGAVGAAQVSLGVVALAATASLFA